MKDFRDVLEFSKKFGLLPKGMGALNRAMAQRRADQMLEELREFEDACLDENPAKTVDALVDLVYFALGSAVQMGLSDEAWSLCWDAVHSANLRKVRSDEDSEDLKNGVNKPAGWESPDRSIILVLRNSGFKGV